MKNTDNEIEERVKQEIDKQMNLADKEIEERVRRKIDNLDRVVEKEVEQEVKEKTQSKAPESQKPSLQVIPSNVKKGFSKHFSECLEKGACKYIAWLMIVTYLLLLFLMLSCRVFDAAFCLEQSLLGAGFYLSIVSAVALGIAVVISLFAKFTRTAFVFTILLSLPLVIILFATTIKYLAGLFVGLIFILIFSRRF